MEWGQALLTTEDLAGHAFLSGLAEPVLAALARGAADIHLNPASTPCTKATSAALFVVSPG